MTNDSPHLNVPIAFTKPDAKLPTQANDGDAGWDLYACGPLTYQLWQGHRATIPTGVSMAIPFGYYAQILCRSSLAAKGAIILGGVIDSSYRGEWFVILVNSGNERLDIEPGNRIAQFIILPTPAFTLLPVPALENDKQIGGRGYTGFGYSGR